MNIGIIGGGNVATGLANLAVDAGHRATISSRHPE